MHSRHCFGLDSARLFAATLGLAAHVSCAELQVWTVTETRHVLRSELPGNQREARLAAARNEWVSFQILVRADEPMRGVSMKAGELRAPDGKGSGAIRWRFYREHQLHLETGTYRNADFKPDWYPDPLIPFEHPLAGEKLNDARFKAVPFDLSAGETHGFWVDFYVSSNAVAGEYRGACRITAEQDQVVEQTWTAPGQGGADSAWGDLYGAIDIWCPLFSLHRQESAAVRQALGETIWTYTALCQGEPTPWWHIDYPLLNYRVPTWMAWRCRMRGLLYWGGLSYWTNVDDSWQQAPYYAGNGAFQQGQKGILYNGEGSLVYPARAVGYDGIVPTIRLKALRDAVEDYDYLALLEHLGKAAEAEAIVKPLAESFSRWDRNPAAYESARARLAALILSSSSRGNTTPRR